VGTAERRHEKKQKQKEKQRGRKSLFLKGW
jgi:hypothetical protein